MSNPPDGPKANEEEKDFDEESYQKLGRLVHSLCDRSVLVLKAF